MGEREGLRYLVKVAGWCIVYASVRNGGDSVLHSGRSCCSSIEKKNRETKLGEEKRKGGEESEKRKQKKKKI